MIVTVLAALALGLAALPALLYLVNLRYYHPPPFPPRRAEEPAVSVLIPARNEEGSIVEAVESALASCGVAVEVIVLDDHSEDATVAKVEALARRDPRVRLLHGPGLPEGWCGKQHACAVLAGAARFPLLLFVDADVRLEPDGLARLVHFLQTSQADLVSGVPRQVTGSLLEKLLIPLIPFILLGYLPMFWMRSSRHPAFAAGCGQLFLARREAYEAMGGHAAIRTSLHDGITLPREFRKAGLVTDLCDATDLARCRMYTGARALWQGLAKNASEGLGHPGRILPFTVLLLGGCVWPLLLLALFPWLSWSALALTALATVLVYTPPVLGMRRFRHGLVSVVLHPVGVFLLVLIQWYGLGRWLLGRPAEWKGRAYPGGGVKGEEGLIGSGAGSGGVRDLPHRVR
jgi:hypothetical protein